jgi:hydrogenase expression/formation protein HypC
MCLGIPGQVETIFDAQKKLATVNVGGLRRPVNLACFQNDVTDLEELVGEWVLVHVGFAMSRINEEEAQRTLELLAELGELQESWAQSQPAEPRRAAG